MLVGEFIGLLLQEQLQGPFGQPLGGGGGDLLEGAKIDIESRPVVAEGAFCDDFGPPGGEGAELVKFLGSES